ncbi:MAG: PLD nuclease N-terminal domain-containing protein [Deltaproteobacteria bacterium]|nr:PLD nuclease N-terminal domain-containing protein [Deltaproteobacteria bacterium]
MLAALPGPLGFKLLLLFLPMLPNLWGIWHAYRHNFADPAVRMLWLCVCVFLPVLGGLAYLFAGRGRALRRTSRQP